jgi:hypothetical protein
MRESLAYLGLLLGASLACSYPTSTAHPINEFGAGVGGFPAWQELGGSPGTGGTGGGFNLILPDSGADANDGGDAGDDGDASDDADAAAD